LRGQPRIGPLSRVVPTVFPFHPEGFAFMEPEHREVTSGTGSPQPEFATPSGVSRRFSGAAFGRRLPRPERPVSQNG
jgi:hypothetical protein